MARTISGLLTIVFIILLEIVLGKLIDTDNDFTEIEKLEESDERIGPAVTQISKHPYMGSLLQNLTHICSAVILNENWLLTVSKCFDGKAVVSYVTNRNLGNYTIRVGSNYFNKGGEIHKLKLLLNNFDLQISAMKIDAPLKFNANIKSVSLPMVEMDPEIGHLVTMVAWAPNGHMRTVNAPAVDANICDTNLIAGKFICVSGVDDPDRNYCRQDNGGAVMQNYTLIGVTLFKHSCATYRKIHAFPKVSSFSRWLDAIIWDENNRPSTQPTTVFDMTTQTVTTEVATKTSKDQILRRLSLDPVNLPLVPSEDDNSVLPRLSLYEAYIKSLEKAKATTTPPPEEPTTKAKIFEWKVNRNIIVSPGLKEANFNMEDGIDDNDEDAENKQIE